MVTKSKGYVKLYDLANQSGPGSRGQDMNKCMGEFVAITINRRIFFNEIQNKHIVPLSTGLSYPSSVTKAATATISGRISTAYSYNTFILNFMTNPMTYRNHYSLDIFY